MAERRRYTKRQKAEIVGLSVVEGQRAAARETGVPLSTIHYWQQSAEFAQLRTRKKDEVAEEVWAAFQTGVRRIVELIPITDDLTKVATAAGIIYDKFALMSGGATARTESVKLSEGLNDHEREQLRAVLDDVLAKVEA